MTCSFMAAVLSVRLQGEILAQAPRNEPAVLVAELDFDQRALWGRLFPFAQQREPETYHELIRSR